MKDKVSKIKYKRKHIDWVKAIFDLKEKLDVGCNPDWWLIYTDFVRFKDSHPSMSKNRCAYNVLKTYYSTTAIVHYRICGYWL